MPDLFGESEQAEVILELRPTQRDENRATVRVGIKDSKKKPRVVATLTSRIIADMGLHVGRRGRLTRPGRSRVVWAWTRRCEARCVG